VIRIRSSRLIRIIAAVAVVGGAVACGDDGSTSPSPSPATTDEQGTGDFVEIAPESVNDAETVTGSVEASTEERSSSSPEQSMTTPPEALVEVSTAPGSGDFVGALEDVQGLVCSQDDGVWTASGTVVNSTVDVVDYRIYVSFLDAGGETVGLIESDSDDVAAGAEQEWSIDIEWPADDLRCVLRVERIAH
jgi:hypothetical protein